MYNQIRGSRESDKIYLRGLSKAAQRKWHFSCKKKEQIKPKKETSEFIKHGFLEPFNIGAIAQNISVAPNNVLLCYLQTCGFVIYLQQ